MAFFCFSMEPMCGKIRRAKDGFTWLLYIIGRNSCQWLVYTGGFENMYDSIQTPEAMILNSQMNKEINTTLEKDETIPF